MNIFIGENESKDEVFDQLTQKLDIKKFKNEFNDVFKKVNNNWVGYCLFEDEGEYYKIFVLPKYIKNPKNSSEDADVIKQFIEYIKVHYQLKAKYDQYDPNSLNLKSNFELSPAANKPHAVAIFPVILLYLPLGIQSLKINLDLKNDKLKIKNVW